MAAKKTTNAKGNEKPAEKAKEKKYKVNLAFFDREDDRKFYAVGDEYKNPNATEERLKLLTDKGYIA